MTLDSWTFQKRELGTSERLRDRSLIVNLYQHMVVPKQSDFDSRTMSFSNRRLSLVSLVSRFAAGVFPGLVTLAMAVLVGDMGTSLGVTGNAMRLSRTSDPVASRRTTV